MLDQARARLERVPVDRLRLEERTAAEIDRLEDGEFDVVVASLVFSEMSSSERAFVLREIARLLRPGGLLAIADEVQPRPGPKRWLHRLVRLPLALLAWLVTGRTSRAIPDLVAEIEVAGLKVRSEERRQLGTYAVVVAERPIVAERPVVAERPT